MALIIAGTVFGLLLAIGVAIAMGIEQNPVLERMAQIGEQPETEPILTPELAKSWRERVVTPFLDSISSFISNLAPSSMLQDNRQRLQRAGRPWGLTAEVFLMLRGVSVIGAVVVTLVIVRGGFLPPTMNWLAVIATVSAGLLGPSWIIDRTANERCRQIRKALPEAIDLLVVSVEAGLGLDGAISEIIKRESGPLADEFAQALTEIGMGKQRQAAWRNLADRTQVSELSAFMAAICQAEELGSSISKVLRSHSETLRIKRKLYIRELANKIPVKMLFPLVFCIFPCMFVVILGPGALTILETVGKLGS